MLNCTDIGTPCILHYQGVDIVGRITAHVDGCEVYNGLHALVMFTTPHGTVTKTGIGYLEHADEKCLEILADYEKEVGEECAYKELLSIIGILKK